MTESLNSLDRKLVRALQIDGRAPFARIAAVLGVSDQTVARRYTRLRQFALARVVALTDHIAVGEERWYLRIGCAPEVAVATARALARRADTAWTDIVSGGTEVDCVVQTPTATDRNALLLERLPRTPRITSVSAHGLLHVFYGGPGEHAGLDGELTAGQQEQLAPPKPETAPRPVRLDDRDRRLLAELSVDGRTGYERLAAATGTSEATARRRLERLRTSGAVFFDVEVDPRALGYTVGARLWLSVPPSALDEVGTALAAHPEVGFVAATTGMRNLVAAVVCRDSHGLYEYVSRRLGAIPAIRDLEVAPVIRSVKGAGTLLGTRE